MHPTKRILAVDDSKRMTACAASVLKDLNYEEIGQVYDGVYALTLLRKRPYDLVIADGQMRPISALLLAELIKADLRLRDVRTIIIGSNEGEHPVLHNGVDGYVTKPFEPADLKGNVQDVHSTISQPWSG